MADGFWKSFTAFKRDDELRHFVYLSYAIRRVQSLLNDVFAFVIRGTLS